MRIIATSIFALLFAPSFAMACMLDVDCFPGSRCVKSSTSIYGICAGGMFPGNSHDNNPVSSPLDIDGTIGNTCSFDIDCGVSNRCYKQSGIYGVCVKRR